MPEVDAPQRDNLATVEVKVVLDVVSPPLVDTPVAFIDPSGWGYVVRTGPDGIARGEVVEGGSVVAAVGRNPGDIPTLFAMLGVHDGDRVHLGTTTLLPWEASAAGDCDEVDFTATFTNVTTHGVAGISLERDVPYRGYAHGQAESVDSTVVHTLTGTGGDTALLQMSLTGPSDAQQYVSEWIDGCRAEYTLDLSVMLPWIAQATVDGSRIDVPRSGGSLDGDVLATMLQATDGSSIGWHVISPPLDSFKLPPLPGELAAHNPTGELVPYVVELDDYELVDGYDAARQIIVGRSGNGGIPGLRELGRMRRSFRIL